MVTRGSRLFVTLYTGLTKRLRTINTPTVSRHLFSIFFTWPGLQEIVVSGDADAAASNLFSGNFVAHSSVEYCPILPGAGMKTRHNGQGNPIGGSKSTHDDFICAARQV